jgi:hypothetical protein
MVRALALKELKESAWLWLLAAAAYAIFALDAMRFPLMPTSVLMSMLANYSYGPTQLIPFVNPQIATMFGWITAGFALALGIWQSFGESWRGAYPLVLHLPLSRRRMVGVKLATGMAITLGVAAIALVIVCVWAATPGTHASPFEWSMTAQAWRVWLASTIFYLGAFATGIYPARWIGTRLFPTVAASLTGCLLLMASGAGSLSLAWFLAILIVTDAVLLVVIDGLANTRDFS